MSCKHNARHRGQVNENNLSHYMLKGNCYCIYRGFKQRHNMKAGTICDTISKYSKHTERHWMNQKTTQLRHHVLLEDEMLLDASALCPVKIN